MPQIRLRLVATIVVLACAACSDAGSKAGPTESPQKPVAMPSGSTSSVPSALASYTADQRSAFASAVRALHRFTATNDRFLGQGRLTTRQAAFYRKNSIHWVDDWATLSRFVNSKVTYVGSPTEVWLRPLSIVLSSRRGRVVTVRRCLDASKLRVFADGKAVSQPQLKVPHVYEVSMLMKPGETWWRVGLPKQGPRC